MFKTYDSFTINSIFWPNAFIKKNMHFTSNYIVSVPPFCTKWWNRDYVVESEVYVFCFDKGLWPKY